jgi:predicted lipase
VRLLIPKGKERNNHLLFRFTDRDYLKYGIGRLVGELLDEIQWRVSAPQPQSLTQPEDGELPKLLLYCGHDTTLMPLLCALQVIKFNLYTSTQCMMYTYTQ